MKIRKLFAILTFTICTNVHAAQVWFCPVNTDFLNNKSYIKEWPESSKKINVIKFYHGLIYNTNISILKKKFDTLKSLNIKVAIELPVITDPDASKLKYQEGFERLGYVDAILKKLKNNNIKVDYFVFDEPLYFGGYRDNRSNNSKYSIESSARDSLENIKLIQENYPNAILGIVEPVQLFSGNDFYRDVIIYHEFMKSNGINISFVQDDIVWDKFNTSKVNKLIDKLKNKSIDFHLIINSDSSSSNNSQWLNGANSNLKDLMGIIGKNNISVVFQSWNKYPNKIIPEWEKDAHMSQILFFEKLTNK